MSLAFNSGSAGIIQQIERQLGLGAGYISDNATRLAEWTADINLTLDDVFHIIFGADGKWDFDDGNHTTDPILTTDLVSGQRDYPFSEDADGNLILDIKRVFVRSSTTTPYKEIFPIDVQSDLEGEIGGLADGLNTEAIPNRYDKTARSVFLEPIPPDTVTAGLKFYVNREGSYFLTSDTTKTPGFAGLYHEYLVLKPAYKYARANNLAVREVLKRDVLELEEAITAHYSRRSRDERTVMTNEFQNYE